MKILTFITSILLILGTSTQATGSSFTGYNDKGDQLICMKAEGDGTGDEAEGDGTGKKFSCQPAKYFTK